MIDKIEDKNTINIGHHIGHGLSAEAVVKIFGLKQSDMQGKNITEIGAGYSPFPSYIKYRYEPENVTLVDQAFANMNAERYYRGLDLAVNELKSVRGELDERLETAREEYDAIKDALLTSLDANDTTLEQGQYNLERYIHEKSAYSANIGEMISEHFTHAREPLTFNDSKVQNIQGIPENSQDMVFSRNLFKHLKTREDEIASFKSVYKILKDGGRYFDIDHTNYAKIWQGRGVSPKGTLNNSYAVELSKEELGELIKKLETEGKVD